MEELEFLTKEQIVGRFDRRLSWRAAEALAFMNDAPLCGMGDVGRLMPIQGFRADWLLPGKAETRCLETWRQHYKSSPISSHDPNGSGDPFLVVKGLCNKVYIYKYRVIVDEENKKRAYHVRAAKLRAEKA